MTDYATIEDIETMWRPLKTAEESKAEALLTTASAMIRTEAYKVGKNFDDIVADSEDMAEVAKIVTVNMVSRVLSASTDAEPMTQMTQSALGYSFSGTYLVPGGDLCLLEKEKKKLGLKRQRYGRLAIYDNTGDHDPDN